jgi:DNA-binding NarL/FixJ family response regulator
MEHTPMPERRILFVSADESVADRLGNPMRAFAEVEVQRSPRAAFADVYEHWYDLVVVDLGLGDPARGLARAAGLLDPAVPVIVLTESAGREAVEEAIHVRARSTLHRRLALPEMARLAVARALGEEPVTAPTIRATVPA